MKITAINGSPNGEKGATNIMVSNFLKGAEQAGAEIVNIFLADKEVNHCKGCFTCWLVTPGKCTIKDDMEEIIAQGEGTDVLVLATPLKYGNLTSMMKVFIERMLVMCNPYFAKDPATGLTRHPKKSAEAEKNMSFYRAKLIQIANGGLPDRGPNFQIISDWLNRLAFYNHTEIIGEIYCPQGLLLGQDAPELKPLVDNYLQSMQKAGQEIAAGLKISEETKQVLDQTLLPVDQYNEIVNNFFDGFLSKVEHSYMK